jgi:hypothetical protein
MGLLLYTRLALSLSVESWAWGLNNKYFGYILHRIIQHLQNGSAGISFFHISSSWVCMYPFEVYSPTVIILELVS